MKRHFYSKTVDSFTPLKLPAGINVTLLPFLFTTFCRAVKSVGKHTLLVCITGTGGILRTRNRAPGAGDAPRSGCTVRYAALARCQARGDTAGAGARAPPAAAAKHLASLLRAAGGR